MIEAILALVSLGAVGGLVGLAAIAERNFPEARAARASRNAQLLPAVESTLEVRHRGLLIHVAGGAFGISAHTAVRVRPGAILTTSGDYPTILAENALRVRGPRPDVIFETPNLEFLLRRLGKYFKAIDIACDGDSVKVYVGGGLLEPEILKVVYDAIALMARWDDGLASALRSLAGASVEAPGDLDPGVVIAPGDVRVGVTADGAQAAIRTTGGDLGITPEDIDSATRARLATAGEGDLHIDKSSVRYVWRGIERDPERIQAAIDALRTVRGAVGPYR